MTTRLLLPFLLLAGACGLQAPSLTMAPLDLTAQRPIEADHFKRDQPSAISEEALQQILAAPVFLEEGARLGVVPVATNSTPVALEAAPTLVNTSPVTKVVMR